MVVVLKAFFFQYLYYWIIAYDCFHFLAFLIFLILFFWLVVFLVYFWCTWIVFLHFLNEFHLLTKNKKLPLDFY